MRLCDLRVFVAASISIAQAPQTRIRHGEELAAVSVSRLKQRSTPVDPYVRRQCDARHDRLSGPSGHASDPSGVAPADSVDEQPARDAVGTHAVQDRVARIRRELQTAGLSAADYDPRKPI